MRGAIRSVFIAGFIFVLGNSLSDNSPSNRRRKNSRLRKPVVAQKPNPDRLAYNVNEVAFVLNCSPNTVWGLVGDGSLASFKVNRRRLISRDVVEKFMANGGTGEVV